MTSDDMDLLHMVAPLWIAPTIKDLLSS